MSKIQFHKCIICGSLFYHGSKDRYCAKCVPSFKGMSRAGCVKTYHDAVNNAVAIRKRRARERERWRRRMADPAFREKERIRSLVRATANKKYLVKEV